MLKTRSAQHKVNQEAYAIVIAHLVKWPADVRQLVDISGLTLRVTQELMRALYRREAVYIAGWERNERGAVAFPVFALKTKASQVDVPKPNKSRAQSTADYRARKKRERERLANLPPPDPMMAALYGVQ